MKRNQYCIINGETSAMSINTRFSQRRKKYAKRRRYIKRIAFIIFYCLVLVVGFCKVSSVRDNAYEKAIEYIKKDNFKSATLSFEELHFINYKSFPVDVINGKDFDKYYKDSAVLYAYTQAVSEYKSDSSHHVVDKWLRVLPEDYNGELSEEIDAFRKEFESAYKGAGKKI